jgi:hypothetical protein
VAIGWSNSPRPSPRKIAPATPGADKKEKDRPAPKPPERGRLDIPEEQEEKPAPRENPAVAVTTEGGTIRGEVRWKGPVPPVEPGPHTVVTVRGKLVAVRPAPRVQVDPILGGLANAVVYLKKAPPSAAPVFPETVTVVQTKGRFEPHVQVVALESKLHLRTTDDTADFQLSGVTSFARGLARGRSHVVGLNRRGLVKVESDDRPWMTPAYVHVLDHDHFAVTAGNGKFVLRKLPAGEHQVVLWHEGWRRGEGHGPPQPIARVVTVKVGPRQGAALEWVLPAP